MSFCSIIFQPWKSYFANHSPVASLMVRIVLFMHLTNLILGLPTEGQDLTEVTHHGRSPVSGSPVTTIPRSRCKCHSRGSSKRGSSPSHTQDLAMFHENAEEGFQYSLKVIAYLTHRNTGLEQNHGSNPNSNHSRHAPQQHKRGASNGPKSQRKHNTNFENPWDDGSVDETVRGQIILEQTWSKTWGKCPSNVCDERTCRGWTVSIACVGPCRWYRRYRCPHKFGEYCVTSPDYEGCNSRMESKVNDNKFHIVDHDSGDRDLNDQGQIERDDDDDDEIDDDDDQEDIEDNEDTENEAIKSKPRHDMSSNKSTDIHQHSKKDGTPTQNPKDMPHQVTPAFDLFIPILPQPSAQAENQKKGSGDDGNGHQHSDVVASGIRYVWVVSCIVVPTMVFCIGYAIAMHLRRKHILQQSRPNRPIPPSSSEPFIPVSAPPYSVEDIYACPRVGMSGCNLSIQPPSYEVAMSATEIAASRERTRTLSACSEFLQEQQLSCSVPLMSAPPPYDGIRVDVVTATVTRGHTRLPSYDSAICLHTSI